jgi:hypothetical protein
VVIVSLDQNTAEAVPQPAAGIVPDPAAETMPDPAAETARPGATRESFAGNSPGTNLDERWREIQIMFVDDPRGSVERAADLARDTLRGFSNLLQERERSLRSTWQGTNADTEELRTSLRSYRALVDRVAEFSKQP